MSRLALLLFILCLGCASGGNPTEVEIEFNDNPTLGSPDAPVQMIFFTDFECSYCKQLSADVMSLKDDYIETGVMRIQVRNFPLESHLHAFDAARCSLCAHEQDRFWEMYDALYQSQGSLDSSSFESLAKTLNLDLEKFRSCMADDAVASQVQSDMNEGSRIGVTGTPSIVINGTMYKGAPPRDILIQLIEKEL